MKNNTTNSETNNIIINGNISIGISINGTVTKTTTKETDGKIKKYSDKFNFDNVNIEIGLGCKDIDIDVVKKSINDSIKEQYKKINESQDGYNGKHCK
jgi:hypothetical protein